MPQEDGQVPKNLSQLEHKTPIMLESLFWLHTGNITGYIYLTETKSIDHFFFYTALSFPHFGGWLNTKITLISVESTWQRVAYCPWCCLNSGAGDKFVCYRDLYMTPVPKLVRGNASLHRLFLYERKSCQCRVLRDNITFLSSISKISHLCKGFVNVNPGL